MPRISPTAALLRISEKRIAALEKENADLQAASAQWRDAAVAAEAERDDLRVKLAEMTGGVRELADYGLDEGEKLTAAEKRIAELEAESEDHQADLIAARRRIDELDAKLARLGLACEKNESGIQQILGKALGYPWFKDDQKNFPGATEADGVCVGDHVAVTLAMEASRRIAETGARLQLSQEAVRVLLTELEAALRTARSANTAEWARTVAMKALEG